MLSWHNIGKRDFRNSNLIVTNLRNLNSNGINLDGANLAKESLAGTNFRQANLTDTLSTVTPHHSPFMSGAMPGKICFKNLDNKLRAHRFNFR